MLGVTSRTSPPSEPPDPKRRRLQKRWLLLASPLLVFAGLVALAPSTPPERSEAPAEETTSSGSGAEAEAEPFAYIPDDEVYALELDPRKVRFDLLEGWDRSGCLRGRWGSGHAQGRCTTSCRQCSQETRSLSAILLVPASGWAQSHGYDGALIGIRHDGSVDFGYGELTDERSRTYDTFIGGLHSLYNDLEEPPAAYKGAYSKSMGQRIRYYLPRIRMVMGLREDGRLEVLMSRDGLTLEQSRELARRRQYLAAYMPDHASKSRFIIPGVKGFTEEDANWISGGATSFVQGPYKLRMSLRQSPLRGDLIAGLTPRLTGQESCRDPLDCMQTFGNHLADRALAGLNRVMEQGVEPLARMIWAPSPSPKVRSGATDDLKQDLDRSPLREPPITADPLVLRGDPSSLDGSSTDDPFLDEPELDERPLLTPLPPDLPPPVLLEDAVEESLEPTLIPEEGEFEQTEQTAETNPQDSVDELRGAPPPPELPPLPPTGSLPFEPLPPIDQNTEQGSLFLEAE